MTMVKCPICGTKTSLETFVDIYKSPYINKEYKLYECYNCKLQWWEPLKMFPELYESEIFESYKLRRLGLKKELECYHKAFFKNFPKNVRGRILDVGCGDGIFLKYAKQAGFEVWGIDLDKKSTEIAKNALGVSTIYSMNIEEFYEFTQRKNIKFDLITFFEVLEHQDKPKEFLEMVRKMLREKGWIAGSVPNRESPFQIELHQKIISWIDNPPHHFLRFSKDSLYEILTMFGFQDVKVIKLDLTLQQLSLYIEKKFIGNLDKLKIAFKRQLFTKEAQKMDNVYGFRFGIYKLLKNFRKMVFAPLMFVYIEKLKGNGMNIYFQGRKE